MKKNNMSERLSKYRKLSSNLFIKNLLRFIFYCFDSVILLFIRKDNKIYSKKKILIIANLGLGDAINFLSICDKLRKHFDKANYEITIYVPKGIDKIFESETKFDVIKGVDFNKCVFNIINRIILYKEINKVKYDILIDGMGVTGTSISMYVCNTANAKEKITIINESNNQCPSFYYRRIFNDIYFITEKTISNIEYYNKLCNYVIKAKNEKIKFHKMKKYKHNCGKLGKYYIVFPSASEEIKKWDYTKYAKIIDKIYDKYKIPVLFCGTKNDQYSVNEVIKQINSPYINCLCKTNMLEFIGLIQNARFIITNDTGAYHIAINEEIPVSIISGGYTYDGYIKYDFENNNYKKPYIVVNENTCFNCWFKCPYLNKKTKWPCLDSITFDYAWKIIDKMIGENI